MSFRFILCHKSRIFFLWPLRTFRILLYPKYFWAHTLYLQYSRFRSVSVFHRPFLFGGRRKAKTEQFVVHAQRKKDKAHSPHTQIAVKPKDRQYGPYLPQNRMSYTSLCVCANSVLVVLSLYLFVLFEWVLQYFWYDGLRSVAAFPGCLLVASSGENNSTLRVYWRRWCFGLLL